MRSRRSARSAAPKPPRPEPLAVAIECDGTSIPVSQTRLADLSRAALRSCRARRAMLSITFVTSRRMAKLNREHLGHSGATDVITFALGAGVDGAVIGDIYICPDVARKHASTHRVGIREEIARLVVHGTLHACGWEHPEDDSRTSSPMWRKQEHLLQRFWVPPSGAQ